VPQSQLGSCSRFLFAPASSNR